MAEINQIKVKYRQSPIPLFSLPYSNEQSK